MITRKNTIATAMLLLAAGLGACSDSVGVNGTARVQVLLTDAPIDYIAEAWVDIGAVVLVPAGDNDDGLITLSEDGTNGPVNLLELQNAATQILADAEIEAATYAQLRLIVESASVTLTEGYEFNGGGTEMDLFVPSGAQTGIKLILRAGEGDEDEDGALEISGDMVLVVDFDVSQSFVIQGSPDTPAGIFGVLFKPTIRVIVEDISGTISGSVSTELADTDVDDLTVTAVPVDEGDLEEFQTQTVTTLTDADGDYTLQFMVPGSYWVKVAVPDGLATEPDSTLVEVDPDENVVDVDFEVVTGS
jgi:hypothetical protein